MLALTRRTEYALIAMCHLARVSPTVSSARDIADRHGMPLPLLMNVLKSLTQHGLVKSLRGSHGGYSLGRRPSDVSLSDLVESLEGPIRLVRCVGQRHAEAACEISGTCRIRTPILRVQERLKGFLDTVTIADLAFDDGCVEVPVALLNTGTAAHALHLSR